MIDAPTKVLSNIAFSAETYNEPAAAACGTIEGAAITIPPANIIVISVRLVNLRTKGTRG
jgi:hypothetical protein